MLLKRIISAAIGILYIIAMLLIGGWFYKFSVLMMALIMSYEFYNAFKHKGYNPISWFGFLAISIFYLARFFLKTLDLFLLIPIFIISIFVFSILYKKYSVIDVVITFFGLFYAGFLIYFLIPLAFLGGQYNTLALIMVFLVTWSTDTFAYAFGRLFGNRKLIVDISPNKTIAGAIAGLLGSVLVGSLFGLYLTYSKGLSYSLYHYTIIGFIGGILSQFGDISASWIKRSCDIKDFGRLLPGHGGLLDRFDSLIFTMPIIYIYISYFVL